MADLLELDGLTKVFSSRRDEVVAVDAVSLGVAVGEAVALVGESGSGKTTVARIVAGLERATSGRVTLAGEDWTKPARRSAERRKRGKAVQMVFQDPYLSLDRRQRVRDGLLEVIDLHERLTEAERGKRLAELLDQVGLDERRGASRPSALSGGERQRVSIARALAPRPRLLVLDEAVSALDVSVQAQILNLLAAIHEETDVAYLFISHDLAVVRQVAARILVMRAGRIVEEGTAEAVLGAPKDDYTKLLLDSVPRPGWDPRKAGAPG